MTYLSLLYKLNEKKGDQQRPFISLNSDCQCIRRML